VKLILELSEWHTPATDYPLTQQDNLRLKHLYYAKESGYNMWGVHDAYIFKAEKRLRLTVLQEQLKNREWHTWMIDDPPQWFAMSGKQKTRVYLIGTKDMTYMECILRVVINRDNMFYSMLVGQK